MKIKAHISFTLLLFIAIPVLLNSCRSKRKTQKDEKSVVLKDSIDDGKCKLDFKNAKALTRITKENEFRFEWISAKAKVESLVDEKSEEFDIKLKMRKDSAIWVQILVVGGLVDVAKVLITKDSVKMVDYIHKTYFKGDFNYLNELLNADLDFELIQAVLFGNSAEFSDDENKMKAVTDRENCNYILSTERKRRLRKIQQGNVEVKQPMQTITLNPAGFKIIKNEFVDPISNRVFTANYRNFTLKDSVYAPYNVDIDILAEKKAKVKIEYVRIEKNVPQKISLNIPSKYDAIDTKNKKPE